DNAAETHVEGSKIGATVTWEGAGKDYDINEVIKDSNGKKIDFRFGGNLERAKNKKTGCLTCLDSCPVGIISNTTYTNGAVEKRNEVKFTGNPDVLPEDGTYVAVTYTLED
ncbi:MAG: YdjY domain-containing protein, partial [Finegoldia magna]|nr:YdjY domain-containing protein [Finegoldia magna]